MTPKQKAKRRAILAKQKAEKAARIAKIEEEMKNSTVHGVKVKPKKFRPMGTQKLPAAYDDRNKDVNFVKEDRKISFTGQDKVNYDPIMAERERKAQAEIEAKKKRIAPAYNKGAYQYITDDTNPAEIGRKI